ncbi:glycosyltransferase family 2 protein [Rubrivirga sp.]|uniref:glycosyltransferase family 2 protein n=1 Tax=Rubrivirga sp. TaxID=1885344 RepID=UPI003B52EDF5
MTPPAPLRVLHLPLVAPPAISASGRGGAYAVFWHGDVPLGHDVLHDDALPLPASAVQERALQVSADAVLAHLHGDGAPDGVADGLRSLPPGVPLLDQVERAMARVPAGPTVTVVVCTRDRPGPLATCLEALARLDPAPDEVVVVDNAPTSSATRDVVEAAGTARYVREPTPGLDHARNRGAREATSDVVAYTDDDVAPHPSWIRGLRRGFADAGVDAVTGLVLPAELETESQWTFEREWGFNRGYRPRLYGPAYFARTVGQGAPVWEIGAGANMAFRRSVFDRVGLFDERLDVGAAGCSGDSEFWYRLLAAGRTCRYEPTAVVHHTHRRTDPELHRQIRAYMRGHTAALLVQHERTGHRGNLHRLGVQLPRYFGRRAVRGLVRGFRGREQTLRTEVAGAVAGVAYYLRHRRPRP